MNIELQQGLQELKFIVNLIKFHLPGQHSQKSHSGGVSSISELSDREREIITLYTSEKRFYTMNKTLRAGGDKLTGTSLQEAIELDDTLSKLPNYEGTVKRGLMFGGTFGIDIYKTERVAKKYEVGMELTENSFMSTTKKQQVPKAFKGQIQFVIKSKTGKDISGLSKMDEDEVVFTPLTRFRVTNKTMKMTKNPITDKMNVNNYTIHLEEI